MSTRRLREVCAIALPLLAALVAHADSAASRRTPDHGDRWIPGLSLVNGGLVQDRAASVESDTRGLTEGSNTTFMWHLGVSAELSAPALELPGRPRPFVHGDIGVVINQEDPVTNEGDPGGQPTPTPDPITNVSPVGAVTNRGSATRVQTEPLMLSAGAGISFETALGERQLRIKPSLEWLWQEDRVTTLLGDAESEGAEPLLCDPVCRTIAVEASTTEGFHSLGPGIEFEVDAARALDFLLTLYLSGRVYHVLGDRQVRLRASGDWLREDGMPTTRPDPSSTVDASYERDRWHYRFGVGLRLLWFPE